MIGTLGSVSRTLQWAKPLTLLLGFVSFCVFFCTIFELAGFTTDIYLMPSVLGTLWSANLHFLISTFHRVPAKPTKELKWFRRLKIRLQRAVYYLLGLLFITLTLSALRTSFSMLGIWRDAF